MPTALKIGISVAVLFLTVLYLVISYLVASGVTKADRKVQEDDPSNYGLTFREVEFESRRGDVVLSGWWLPGELASPTVIFVHGIGSVRSGDRAVDLASRLVSQGYNILMFDLRGHGSSGGDQVSGGYFEQWDVLGAFDYLKSEGIPDERIGLVGFSMGAATAILAASNEPGINAVVADSTYAKLSDLIGREAARKSFIPQWFIPVFLPTAKLMTRAFYDIDIGSLTPEDAVSRLNYPVLVIHGTGDARIPWEQGERVHSAAHPDSKLWLVPGVDHVDSFLTHPDEYTRRVSDYFDGRLGGR